MRKGDTGNAGFASEAFWRNAEAPRRTGIIFRHFSNCPSVFNDGSVWEVTYGQGHEGYTAVGALVLKVCSVKDFHESR